MKRGRRSSSPRAARISAITRRRLVSATNDFCQSRSRSIGRKRGGLWSVAFLTTWVCSVAASRHAGAADNAPEAAPFRVRVPHNDVAQAVKRALAGADRLLAEPACQEVLTDFRDASART